jgi:adenosyl cobinamide kinase/adenosyl cobinamide phosphate guanylyltransferase
MDPDDLWKLGEAFLSYAGEEMLYYGTTTEKLDALLEDGLEAPSHWGTLEMATLRAEEAAEEDGGDPVVITKSMTDFSTTALQADEDAIKTPAQSIVARSEEQIAEEWEKSDKSWEDSLDLAESVLYDGHLEISEDEIDHI